jgi:hypothetical protein
MSLFRSRIGRDSRWLAAGFDDEEDPTGVADADDVRRIAMSLPVLTQSGARRWVRLRHKPGRVALPDVPLIRRLGYGRVPLSQRAEDG